LVSQPEQQFWETIYKLLIQAGRLSCDPVYVICPLEKSNKAVAGGANKHHRFDFKTDCILANLMFST